MNYLREVMGERSHHGTARIQPLAMRVGQELLTIAISRYAPEEDDGPLLDSSDARVRYKIMVRRDERLVLMWWRDAFRLALGTKPVSGASVDLLHVLQHVQLSAL